LREKGHTAVIEGIPEGDFTVPQAVLLEMRERVRKETKVARDKCLQPEDHLRKAGEHQQR